MRLLYLLVIILVCNVLHAQEYPDYGNITSEEKQLKVCPFDKDAEAVILVDEAASNYNDENNLITSRHIKIKILKQKGIDLANISIPYYNKDNFEIITNVRADAFTDDGTGNYVSKSVERKAIYNKNSTDQVAEVKFTFPSVQVGSILEYTYISTMKHYGGLRDWYFQSELPVMTSRYKLYILPNLEFAYKVYKTSDLHVTVTPDKNSGSIYFEMKNIGGLREEPYMDSRNDYLQRVTFQLSAYHNGFGKSNYLASWNDVAKEMRSDDNFGNRLDKTIPGTEQFVNESKLVPTEERIKKIYDYVRENLTWNGRHSRLSMSSSKEVWSRKSGTSGEINIVLVNLLRSAGLDVWPVLVSERSNGKVYTDYPFLDQFNSIVACVKKDTSKYFLDATDKYTPANITPYELLNTTGILINKKSGDIVNIANKTVNYKENILIQATILPDDNIKGFIHIASNGYSRIVKIKEYENNKQAFLDEYFNRLHEGIGTANFEITNRDNDSLAFIQHCEFNMPLPGTGDYHFMPLDMLPGFQSNPFVGDNRFSNINFGYGQSISFTTQVQLPDNYVVDALPKALKLTNQAGDMIFTRRVYYEKELNKISSVITIEISNSLYGAEDYPEIKEFFKKMYGFLAEQVVLKKK